jgi:hypothetical protein
MEELKQEPQEQPSASPGPSPRTLLIAAIVLACATAISLFYAFRERNEALQLAASQEQMSSNLSQTRTQADALNSQLNDLSARLTSLQQQQATESAAAAATRTRHAAGRSVGKAHARREDPRLKRLQAQLAEQQKQIASTQQDVRKTRSELEGNLSSTRDELNGSIAKTHDELVALERRGERNYYEFDLSKSKQFKRVGPMSLSLRKTSAKHENYTLMMLVDDRQLTKKSVNLYEPVLFYPPDSTQPLQLVVNQIGKDQVHGYVSEPKYKKSDLTASSASSDLGSSSTSQGEASLPHRTEPQH